MTKGIHIDNKIHKKYKKIAAEDGITIREAIERKLA